jgi:hypothetical protein
LRHSFPTRRSSDLSCLHSTRFPMSTHAPPPADVAVPPALARPPTGDFGDATSLLLTEALVRAFTVTLVEICCGWELAADVVNSSCCTISTENLVRFSCCCCCCCCPVHWILAGGSNASADPPGGSSSSAVRFRNFCC